MRNRNYRALALTLKETKFTKGFDTWACQKFNLSSDEVEAWIVAQPITRLIHLTESFARDFRSA